MQTKFISHETQKQKSSSLPKSNNSHKLLPSLSLSALVYESTQILTSLSEDIRSNLLQFQVPNLFETLRNSLKTLEYNDPHIFSTQSRKLSENEEIAIYEDNENKQKTKKTCSMGHAVLFVSEGSHFLNQVTFDKSLLNKPPELLRFLTEDVQDKHRKLLQQILDKPLSLECVLSRLKNAGSCNKILSLFKQYLRSQLFLTLYRLTDSDPPEQKRNKIDLSSFWKSLSKDSKIRILLQNCKDSIGLSDYLRKQKINLSLKKLTQIIDKFQSCEIEFQSSFEQILDPSIQYLKMVHASLRKQSELSKRKRYSKVNREERDYNSEHKTERKEEAAKKKKTKGKKSMSIESNETNYTEHEGNLKQKMTENQLEFKRKSNEAIELSENQKDDISIQSKETFRQFESKFKDQQQKVLGIELEIKQPVSFYTTFLGSETEETSFNPLPLKSHSGSTTLEKLEEQLSAMSDCISEEANEYFERRIIAYERIQFLLQHYSIPIKLFGSCANGIAVKNSDVDIAIDQSVLHWFDFIPDSEKVVVALQKLSQIFGIYPCFKEIKVIKTAAIPVMKMTIDTSIVFINQEYKSLNRSHNWGRIQADITIQTPSKDEQTSHLGLRTTDAISKWISEIISLRTLIVVMKSFFTASKLNLTYQGGLNTLSMIVMMVAFIKHKNMEQQQNCALVLQNILEFYVNEFDEKERGIDLLDSNGEHIFYNKKQYSLDTSTLMKADIEVRDPICQSKNMTRNGYLYPKIKQLFKRILQQCFYSSNVSDQNGQSNVFLRLQSLLTSY